MNVDILGIKGTWKDVYNSCQTTINRSDSDVEPDSIWKRKILKSEHSPIRQLIIKWRWTELPYWVSVHLVRHKFGIEHWVRTQRSDRTSVPRDELPQGALIEHECEANAQAIISISRKRLCCLASTETRAAWGSFLVELSQIEPTLVSVCVPECVYRGFCPELKSCGYTTTSFYEAELEDYRSQT